MSPIKLKILQTFLLHDKALKPIEISKELGIKFPSVMMHIIGLTRMEYLISPEKGFYTITAEGKRGLDFYLDIDKPLDIKVINLQTFNAQLKTVPVKSIDFHMKRGDFEAWFKGLGDLELAKKTGLLRKQSFCGELLRRKLQILIVNRIMVLAKIAGFSVVKK
ncbi:MAG: hypothetical protein AC479_07890 [miscellaneous Crenarchaeota group-6 archaeon AD8-1]|nr:MAG: hypothetical protein AC479_07890 [miscellaneous Crenarchaeota group-6 archaeon AD8-1]